MNQITHQKNLSEIGKILINQKMEMGYAQSSIRICENDLERLRAFMKQEGADLYSIDIGKKYLATEYCNKTDIRHSIIIKAALNEKSPDNHRYFREILKFLAEMEILSPAGRPFCQGSRRN